MSALIASSLKKRQGGGHRGDCCTYALWRWFRWIVDCVGRDRRLDRARRRQFFVEQQCALVDADDSVVNASVAARRHESLTSLFALSKRHQDVERLLPL